MKQRTPLFGLLAANAISITGNRLTQLAIPWFVLQSTGSVAKTGLVGFFSLLPFVISSALGGVIVDRLGYRRASIVSTRSTRFAFRPESTRPVSVAGCSRSSASKSALAWDR